MSIEDFINNRQCFEVSADGKVSELLQELIGDYAHSVRNRLMTLNIDLHLLEKKSCDADRPMIERLRGEVVELTNLIETLQVRIKPCE